ncbi:hypothetical protein RvY_05785 [Ramazzottius varieornatus]|uniref:Ribosomal protein L1 n=1 Tax=Ramazzottius varieornatus TaxID=947166 RepID=A0A1D1UZV4_RAMVA|nr:hypothetical protein RvY_05785 [Ramazzottius varieornatus]
MDYATDQVEKAVSVLVSGHKKSQEERPTANKSLLTEDEKLQLTIVQIRMPPSSYKKLKCDLPAPFRIEGSAEVCLIIKDTSKDKLFDQERGVLRYKEYLRTCGVIGITEVITYSQLRAEYKPFEAKRKLLGRYDLFLADERIYGKLATVLGSKFFVKNKFPVAVIIENSSTIASSIRSAIRATYLTVNGKGPQSTMEVGSLDQTQEEMVKNVDHAISFLKKHFPAGWNNIRSLYLKMGKLSLPIYINQETANAVVLEKTKKIAGFDAPAQEITTVPDARVKVCRDGSIKVLKKKKSKNAQKKTISTAARSQHEKRLRV